jgi:hypothetical protein
MLVHINTAASRKIETGHTFSNYIFHQSKITLFFFVLFVFWSSELCFNRSYQLLKQHQNWSHCARSKGCKPKGIIISNAKMHLQASRVVWKIKDASRVRLRSSSGIRTMESRRSAVTLRRAAAGSRSTGHRVSPFSLQRQGMLAASRSEVWAYERTEAPRGATPTNYFGLTA